MSSSALAVTSHRGSKRAIVVWSILAAGVVLAAEPRPVLHGHWTATAGPTVLRGIWSAQALPSSANAVVGSWALLNGDGEVTLQGTWTARRSPPGWRGAWRAQVKPTGGSFAGSWEAALPPDFKGKTFEDLLRESGARQISGNWRAGRGGGGNWWLTASP